MVLVVCLDLLRRSGIHQALHPLTIFEDLPAGQFSQSLLWPDCDYRRLELLGDFQRSRHVHPDQSLLDSRRFLQ